MAITIDYQANVIEIPHHASAPPTPSTGRIVLYAKTDGRIYIKDDAGTERRLFPIRTVANLDFPNLSANGGQADLTVTVTGAEVSDFALVTTDVTPPSGVMFQAWVSNVNEVTVRATNVTPGAVNPAAQDFLVLVFKQ